MSFKFEWNEFADQPHNVAPRGERMKFHLRHAGGYLLLAGSNLRAAVPALRRYRRYRKALYTRPVEISNAFGLACSPAGERNEEVVRLLEESGARLTLVRVPSWERGRLDAYQKFIESLRGRGFDCLVALLQNRNDVVDPSSWRLFLEDIFSRFSGSGLFFEIGHAWNRTKWGVWDFREYLGLARPAAELAVRYGVKIAGPAVIDFEFHLYPPVLRAVSFDAVTSLLYVDRVGAPENAQFGWTTPKKAALLRAAVDVTPLRDRDLWITEVNWPLEGMGLYSPAPGKPCVSEVRQADYLVRYHILCLASGFVRRIYWWQLAAPGYGLVDNREPAWRKRPAFEAFRTLARELEGSVFAGKAVHPRAEIFLFRRGGEEFAVGWTRKGAAAHVFPRPVRRIMDRDGRALDGALEPVAFEESPRYVFFRSSAV
jgi:hypothetical protein